MVATVTIPKKEYDMLKKLEKEAKKIRQQELEDHLDRSLADLKAGRVIRYA